MNPDQQPVAPNPQPQPPAPQPQMTAPAPMGGPTPMSGGKKMSKSAIIGILAAVVVLAGAVAYGVYAYISNTPDNLLLSAVDNLKDKKSLAASYKIVNGTEQNGVTLSGDIAAATDPSNSKNGEAIVGFGSGAKRVAINALSLNGSLYLKAVNAENLGDLLAAFGSSNNALTSPAFAAELKNLDGQWFEMNATDVQSIAQSSGNSNVSGAVSPEDLKKVMDLYHQHPFIKADKTYADQVVDGANSAHFSVKNDPNTEVAFLQAVKDANLSTIKVTDDDIAKAKAAPSTISDGSIEIWVARDSRQFKQIKITNTKKGEESAVTLTLMSSLPTFDKFEKPSGVKPISQLFTTLLGPSISPSELNALEESNSSLLQ